MQRPPKRLPEKPSNYTMDHYDYLWKVRLVGDSGVGKSEYLNRLVHDEFDPAGRPTIGQKFYIKTFVSGPEEKRVKLQLWDFGSGSYTHITNSCYRGAVAFIIFYDISRSHTFENAKKHYRTLKAEEGKNVVFMLLGTKCDLRNLREVSTEYAEEFAENEDIIFTEVSAESGKNVQESAQMLVDNILYTFCHSAPEPKVKQEETPEPAKEEKGCVMF